MIQSLYRFHPQVIGIEAHVGRICEERGILCVVNDRDDGAPDNPQVYKPLSA
jgi:hypothetical protein